VQAGVRPMRLGARRAFIGSYRKARLWLDRLIAGTEMSVASIAHDERRTERSNSSDALARLSRSYARRSCDGGTSAARLRSQANDGPARPNGQSNGARSGLRSPSAAEKSVACLNVVGAAGYENQPSTACGELDVAASRQQRHRAGKQNFGASDRRLKSAAQARHRPAKAFADAEQRTALLTYRNRVNILNRGNHHRSRGLSGGDSN